VQPVRGAVWCQRQRAMTPTPRRRARASTSHDGEEVEKGRPLGFHATAYDLWVGGQTQREVSVKMGVKVRQVERWASKERWQERLDAAQRKAAALLVERSADHLVRLALRHRKGARAIQRYALGLIRGGTIIIDPETGAPSKHYDKDNNPVGLALRPIMPGELNQAAQAYLKAADLEYGRAGGKTQEAERTSPDLVVLMERVWAESHPPRVVGAGSTNGTGPAVGIPDADPRMRALKARGEV